MEAIAYFRDRERQEIEDQLDRVEVRIGVIKAILVGIGAIALAFTAIPQIDTTNTNLCHPINPDVYRDSTYCIRLKTMREFFVGKGGLR